MRAKVGKHFQNILQSPEKDQSWVRVIVGHTLGKVSVPWSISSGRSSKITRTYTSIVSANSLKFFSLRETPVSQGSYNLCHTYSVCVTENFKNITVSSK